MVTLHPVDSGNFDRCVALQVHPTQAGFVASNLKSIAQAKIYPTLIPLVIRTGEELIGFILHGLDPDSGRHHVVRFMIDAAHQGRGHGRAALQVLINQIQREQPGTPVYVSFVPGNTAAMSLYAALGFQPTGETDPDGEIIYRLPPT